MSILDHSWPYDPEAVIQDADIEQAELEAAGREHANRERRACRAFRQGNPTEAARICRHGSGYPLNSPAAEHAKDPRAGSLGYRCTSCGSAMRFDPLVVEGDPEVTAPCEYRCPWVELTPGAVVVMIDSNKPATLVRQVGYERWVVKLLDPTAESGFREQEVSRQWFRVREAADLDPEAG